MKYLISLSELYFNFWFLFARLCAQVHYRIYILIILVHLDQLTGSFFD